MRALFVFPTPSAALYAFQACVVASAVLSGPRREIRFGDGSIWRFIHQDEIDLLGGTIYDAAIFHDDVRASLANKVAPHVRETKGRWVAS